MARAAMVATALVVAAPASAAAQPADPVDNTDTVELLTDVLESLRAGDDADYQAAADELRSGGHWLPVAGWTALDERDDEQLSFVWLLLEAPGEEPLLYAFDQVLLERDLVLTSSAASVADRALLDLVDADGAIILEVLEHRRLGLSREARDVLTRLPDDPADWPSIELYDQVVAMMGNRIEAMGFPLPPIPEIAEIMEAFPLEALPTPPPDHGEPPTGPPPGPPVDTPAESPTVASVTPPVDAPADGSEPLPTDAAAPSVEPDAPNVPEPEPDATPQPASADDETPAPRVDSPANLAALTIGVGVIGALGLAVGVVAMRRHRHHHELVGIAFTDSLTGLGNRRRLDLDLSREEGNGGRPTSMLMIDVDHFKQFNDRHGHLIGDDALRHVAGVIADNVRSRDLTYRYGGEEFSVLLPDTAPDEANDVGERIRRAIEAERIDLPDGSTVAVTASLGLSSGPADEVGALVQRADQALYIAKDSGRNQLARG